MHRSSGSLFDCLVGAAKQRKRHSESERVGILKLMILNVCSLLLFSESYRSFAS